MKNNTPIPHADVEVRCACGNRFTIVSTGTGPLRLESCAHCHPVYTGEPRKLNTTGRIEKFNLRYAKKIN